MSSSENMDAPANRHLSREVTYPASLGYFVLEVLGSLAMLVILNFFALWYLGNYSTNYGYWTLHQKWSLLAKMEAPVDWLILGDSSCNQGVSPAIIAEQMGGSAINLCTIGNVTVLNDLWMLEEYIQRFGPPKAVVVVHVYDIWSRGLSPVILGQIPRPWGFWNEHTLGTTLLENPDIRSDLFLEHYVPLLSQRISLTTILRSVVFGKLTPFESQWHMEDNGFLIDEQARPEIAKQDGQDHMEFVRENDPFISSINQTALNELKEIAEVYQLPIYLVNSPLYEGLFADEVFQAYLGQLRAQIDAVVGQSETIHLIPEVKTFPASQLQTADHVTLPGAQAYTEWLIQRILSR